MKLNKLKKDIKFNFLILTFKRIFKKWWNYFFFALLILITISFQTFFLIYFKNESFLNGDYAQGSSFILQILLIKSILVSILIMIYSFMIAQFLIHSDKSKYLFNLEIKSGINLKSSLMYRFFVLFSYTFILIIFLVIIEACFIGFWPKSLNFFIPIFMTKYSFYLIIAILTITLSFFFFNFFNEYLTYVLAGILIFILNVNMYLWPIIKKSMIPLTNVNNTSQTLAYDSLIYKKISYIAENINDNQFFKDTLQINFDINSLRDVTIFQGNLLNDKFLNMLENKSPNLKQFLISTHNYYANKNQASNEIDLTKFIFNKSDNQTIKNFDSNYFYNIIDSYYNNENEEYNNFIKIFKDFSKNFLLLNKLITDLFISVNYQVIIDESLWGQDIKKYNSIEEISLYWFIANTYKIMYEYSESDMFKSLVVSDYQQNLNKLKANFYLNPLELYINLSYGSFYNNDNENSLIINSLDENSPLYVRSFINLEEKQTNENKANNELLRYKSKNVKVFSYEGFYVFLLLFSLGLIYVNYFKFKKTLIV
ncbi:hypothetical protein SCORR_v1c05220 [Spiroplasma corruscae]|uniref:Uncharacterized protein n=1 Tax=Spiroplasma corruscae TaxID=216934 RepID=A0A222EPU7_9MOLU|nr:hypothetical protein [Spiroplasma corruscae]ASP28294.1 hypothetical protein SCORR_v1c05220 [Spiroplasma corruscae]